MDEQWENLIILDGCRYDLFEEVYNLDGTLHKRKSRGSNSEEFMEENFVDQTFHDTVYVSANPFTEVLLGDEVFHDIINVFDLAWDEDLRTVKPESVVEWTMKAYERYPNKRIISHFMQPHYPFIGEYGKQFDHRGLSGEVTDDSNKSDSGNLPVWTMLRYRLSEASLEDVWAAYAENLELTIPHVEELLNGLNGKSVITADHGNLFGERIHPIPIRTYGHPPGFRTTELVTVPWFVPPFENHRSVQSEPPQVGTTDSSDTAQIQQRLRDLGYV